MRHQHQQKNPRQQSGHHPLSNGTETNNDCSAVVIVETLELRRFAEFCDACKRYRYIGLCYGSPEVGKTLSAHHYANWENVQAYWNHQCQTRALLKEISKGSVVFYTSPVVNSPSHLERDIAKTRSLLHNAAIERARRYEHARMKRLPKSRRKAARPKRNPDGYRSDEAVKAEDAFHEQRNRAMRVPNTLPDPTALLVIDEADRLKMTGLEQVRNIFDHGGVGLVLIGMPGIEKRLARYPQFYSRPKRSANYWISAGRLPACIYRSIVGSGNGRGYHSDHGRQLSVAEPSPYSNGTNSRNQCLARGEQSCGGGCAREPCDWTVLDDRDQRYGITDHLPGVGFPERLDSECQENKLAKWCVIQELSGK